MEAAHLFSFECYTLSPRRRTLLESVPNAAHLSESDRFESELSVNSVHWTVFSTHRLVNSLLSKHTVHPLCRPQRAWLATASDDVRLLNRFEIDVTIFKRS